MIAIGVRSTPNGELMDGRHVGGRIIVVARPALGRMVETTLRGAGYEVHRTPSDLDLLILIARLRPHVVIVALDIPWMAALDTVRSVADGPRHIPVVLLGDTHGDRRGEGLPRLPLAADPALLLATIEKIMAEARSASG